jgi:hypothetical protein
MYRHRPMGIANKDETYGILHLLFKLGVLEVFLDMRPIDFTLGKRVLVYATEDGTVKHHVS